MLGVSCDACDAVSGPGVDDGVETSVLAVATGGVGTIAGGVGAGDGVALLLGGRCGGGRCCCWTGGV